MGSRTARFLSRISARGAHRAGNVAAMTSAQSPDLGRLLGDVERLLKTPRVAESLATRSVNVSLALVALDGLRAYLEGEHGRAAEELGTAAEEIAARHRRASTEKPS